MRALRWEQWQHWGRLGRLGNRLARACASSARAPRPSASHDLAVDMGTATTRLYVPGRGLVLSEPTAIAYSRHTGEAAAAGEAAQLLVGRESRSLRVVRPVREGYVSDGDAAAHLLSYFMNRAGARRGLRKLRVLMVVPQGATGLERRAFEDAACRAGAGRVTLVAQPFALAASAARFAGDSQTVMTVDIGAGKTDVAVLCRRGVICAATLRVGTGHLDRAVAAYLRQTRRLEIGETTAEALRVELGSAVELKAGDGADEFEVGGYRASTGMPEKAAVTRAEVYAAIAPHVRELVGGVRAVLDECPPEAAGDLFETGVLLSGGGALLAGMDELLADATGLAARRVPNPLAAAALGAGRLLEPMTEEADASPTVTVPLAEGAGALGEGGFYSLAESRARELSGVH
jgi:rod shape-determining protein MreB and related proteins